MMNDDGLRPAAGSGEASHINFPAAQPRSRAVARAAPFLIHHSAFYILHSLFFLHSLFSRSSTPPGGHVRRARTLHILSLASACGGLACVGASFGATLVARAAPPAALAGAAAGGAWGGVALLAAAGACEWAASAPRRRDELRHDRRARDAEARVRELAIRLALATAEREHAQAILQH